MNDLNAIFHEEFIKLQENANKKYAELIASIVSMHEIPEITDLEVCKQLEKAHFDIYINTLALSDTAMRLSQMYHYIYLVNKEVKPEQGE
jgi:hypothetical protein